MNEKHYNHKFFVTEIQEIELCGSRIYELTGSGYIQPTDFVRLNYEEHNLSNCSNCLDSYNRILKEVELLFSRFPSCCEHHKKLLTQEWFNKNDFDGYPKLYVDKLFYSWFHTLHYINTEEWKKEIFDYIEYIVMSFGSFPKGFGEPLYLTQYIIDLSNKVSTLDEFSEKKSEILKYLTVKLFRILTKATSKG